MNQSRTLYACPCCLSLTLSLEPPGTYLVCLVCAWEDDPVQFHDPQFSGGANRVSLELAKQNFQLYGCSDPDAIG